MGEKTISQLTPFDDHWDPKDPESITVTSSSASGMAYSIKWETLLTYIENNIDTTLPDEADFYNLNSRSILSTAKIVSNVDPGAYLLDDSPDLLLGASRIGDVTSSFTDILIRRERLDLNDKLTGSISLSHRNKDALGDIDITSQLLVLDDTLIYQSKSTDFRVSEETRSMSFDSGSTNLTVDSLGSKFSVLTGPAGIVVDGATNTITLTAEHINIPGLSFSSLVSADNVLVESTDNSLSLKGKTGIEAISSNGPLSLRASGDITIHSENGRIITHPPLGGGTTGDILTNLIRPEDPNRNLVIDHTVTGSEYPEEKLKTGVTISSIYDTNMSFSESLVIKSYRAKLLMVPESFVLESYWQVEETLSSQKKNYSVVVTSSIDPGKLFTPGAGSEFKVSIDGSSGLGVRATKGIVTSSGQNNIYHLYAIATGDVEPRDYTHTLVLEDYSTVTGIDTPSVGQFFPGSNFDSTNPSFNKINGNFDEATLIVRKFDGTDKDFIYLIGNGTKTGEYLQGTRFTGHNWIVTDEGSRTAKSFSMVWGASEVEYLPSSLKHQSPRPDFGSITSKTIGLFVFPSSQSEWTSYAETTGDKLDATVKGAGWSYAFADGYCWLGRNSIERPGPTEAEVLWESSSISPFIHLRESNSGHRPYEPSYFSYFQGMVHLGLSGSISALSMFLRSSTMEVRASSSINMFADQKLRLSTGIDFGVDDKVEIISPNVDVLSVVKDDLDPIDASSFKIGAYVESEEDALKWSGVYSRPGDGSVHIGGSKEVLVEATGEGTDGNLTAISYLGNLYLKSYSFDGETGKRVGSGNIFLETNSNEIGGIDKGEINLHCTRLDVIETAPSVGYFRKMMFYPGSYNPGLDNQNLAAFLTPKEALVANIGRVYGLGCRKKKDKNPYSAILIGDPEEWFYFDESYDAGGILKYELRPAVFRPKRSGYYKISAEVDFKYHIDITQVYNAVHFSGELAFYGWFPDTIKFPPTYQSINDATKTGNPGSLPYYYWSQRPYSSIPTDQATTAFWGTGKIGKMASEFGGGRIMGNPDTINFQLSEYLFLEKFDPSKYPEKSKAGYYTFFYPMYTTAPATAQYSPIIYNTSLMVESVSYIPNTRPVDQQYNCEDPVAVHTGLDDTRSSTLPDTDPDWV